MKLSQPHCTAIAGQACFRSAHLHTAALHTARTVSNSSCRCATALRPTRPLLQSFTSGHKVIIPPLAALHSGGAHPNSTTLSEYAQHRHLSPEVARFIPTESAAEVQRAQQVDAFRATNDAVTQQLWHDSKSHLRRQQRLVDELGVEGAVRETLQPTTTSFREQLRQRPLDRAILQEIYLGLHGRRIERKLKRGVAWEHWITKGDGTAPVFTTSGKAQQTFAFGGDIRQVGCATHPQHFPTLRTHRAKASAAAASSSQRGGKREHGDGGGGGGTAAATASTKRRRGGSRVPQSHASSASSLLLPCESLLPEVALIGRTSSGKSSLINAVLNATVSPYGHLRGTTTAVRFYNVADRLMLVDCPGYGHYDPMMTPAIDAENAVKAMRAYLACGAAPGAVQRRKAKAQAKNEGQQQQMKNGGATEGRTAHGIDTDQFDEGDGEDSFGNASGRPHHHHQHRQGRESPIRYQPRNLRRVLVCVSAHGLQHSDYSYCDLLESYGIPFSVVLTKTDAAPIRFLARLTDYTRSQLVRYTQCKEILLTSSLRIAGIDKVQELLGSFAAADDPLNGATADFSAIV